MELNAFFFSQHNHEFVFFKAKANEIWEHFSINRRIEDKDEGYQRAISTSRVRKIAKYIDAGNILPLPILVSLEAGKYNINKSNGKIIINDEPDVGWIIDGQHRLAGAHTASSEIEVPVVAICDLNIEQQINQFVTINKEAKGVPTSLYYDLLKHLPTKSPNDRAKERAVDIAKMLRNDEESVFFNRIVAVRSPNKGELSLTTFTKHISSLVFDGKGILSTYNINEQVKIFDNYYKGLKNTFPKYFNENDSVFFKTTGFGALIRVFPSFFSISLKEYQGFTVENISAVLGKVGAFDFDGWKKIGTGNAAEIQAAEDFRQEIEEAFTDQTGLSKINL